MGAHGRVVRVTMFTFQRLGVRFPLPSMDTHGHVVQSFASSVHPAAMGA